MPAKKPVTATAASFPAAADPDFLTQDEVAGRLKFSRRTLRRRVRDGLIRLTPEGGRHLIAIEDFYAYLERLRRAARGPSSLRRKGAV
jgi:excisionase family DNA binding protein